MFRRHRETSVLPERELHLRLDRLDEGRLRSERATQEPAEVGDDGPLDPIAGGLGAESVSVMGNSAAGFCC